MEEILYTNCFIFEDYITSIIDVRLAEGEFPAHEATLERRNMEAERDRFLKAILAQAELHNDT